MCGEDIAGAVRNDPRTPPLPRMVGAPGESEGDASGWAVRGEDAERFGRADAESTISGSKKCPQLGGTSLEAGVCRGKGGYLGGPLTPPILLYEISSRRCFTVEGCCVLSLKSGPGGSAAYEGHVLRSLSLALQSKMKPRVAWGWSWCALPVGPTYALH